VSGDLYDHPVGFFFESVLAALRARTPARLELTVYANGLNDDATTRRIRAAAHAWRVVAGLSDEHLVQVIRDDGIDVLVDLSGHTGRNRLPAFAWKPAPVQATWLGYFATTGVAAIDYLIADPWAVPEGADDEFTESVWRLPETRMCFTPPADAPDVADLPARAGNPLTFGCFSHLTKVNDDVLALWARVLVAVPGSRLFLKAPQLAADTVHDALLARFQAHGIGAERLILEGPSRRADYLAAYEDVDLMLDTFPYPGGTTTAEALWMGVPVLTLAGDTFLSRQGRSLLTNAGLPEWVANDADDFVARAVARAADLDGLADLRRGLRQRLQASPLFDAPRFAAHFEAALRGMWQAWCARSPSGP
jgi:predicted O-linked N-acetylglucosamine transferase (SPINDLY family)